MIIKPLWTNIINSTNAVKNEDVSNDKKERIKLYDRYKKDPKTCKHPKDFVEKQEGAVVGSIRVCRLCGSIVNDVDLQEEEES